MKYMLQFILAALLLMSGLAIGASAGSEGVVVTNAWSRASIGSGRPGAAYMEIRNTGDEPITLTGLRTDLAMMAEIHRTSTNAQGVTSMAPAGEIVIAPDETIALEPGGFHAMLMKLQRPMDKGNSFPLTLLLSDGAEVTVEVPILSIAARGPEG